MIQIVNTIIPIFAIILLGVLIRSRGFMPESFIGPLNKMVYYLAIPAMVFRAIALAPFQANFNPLLVLGTMIPVIVVFVVALGIGLLISISRSDLGTFIQSSFHGNLGYIGLAVAYYYLGHEGFTRTGILAGFLMLLQNFLAVLGHQMSYKAPESGHRLLSVIKRIIANPVILSALAGIIFSVSRIPLPTIIDRSLGIIGGMALPLALLVIGGSLSFKLIKFHFSQVLGAGILKLLILPALGFLVYHWLGLLPSQFLPGMILLAAPTATITYVMSREMQGSPQLASAAVSMNTLLSALTFVFWLTLSS